MLAALGVALAASLLGFSAQATPVAVQICAGAGACGASDVALLRRLEVLDPGGLENPPWGIALHTTGYVGGALFLAQDSTVDAGTPIAVEFTWLGGGDAFFTNGFHLAGLGGTAIDWFQHSTVRGTSAVIALAGDAFIPFHFSVDNYIAPVARAACNIAEPGCTPTSEAGAGQFVSVGGDYAIAGVSGVIGLGDGGGTRCDRILCDYQDATIGFRIVNGADSTAVPEPGSLGLLGGFLALLGIGKGRKRFFLKKEAKTSIHWPCAVQARTERNE